MKNEHWIIYRTQNDPPGIHIVAVCHGEMESQAALANAAITNARQVNEERRERFERGGECGRKVNEHDFIHRYVTAHVIEAS